MIACTSSGSITTGDRHAVLRLLRLCRPLVLSRRSATITVTVRVALLSGITQQRCQGGATVQELQRRPTRYSKTLQYPTLPKTKERPVERML